MKILSNSKIILSLVFSTCFILMNPVSAADAELPYVDQVPMNESMAIDGVWNMVALNKKIRFEGGRAYAVDSWIAYLFWKVHPNMVTLKDVRESSLGRYTGYDLIQKVPMTATLQANGNLKFAAGLFASDFVPVQLDNPEKMDDLLQELGGGSLPTPPNPEILPNPPQSNCSQWAIDPETNSPVCMD